MSDDPLHKNLTDTQEQTEASRVLIQRLVRESRETQEKLLEILIENACLRRRLKQNCYTECEVLLFLLRSQCLHYRSSLVESVYNDDCDVQGILHNGVCYYTHDNSGICRPCESSMQRIKHYRNQDQLDYLIRHYSD